MHSELGYKRKNPISVPVTFPIRRPIYFVDVNVGVQLYSEIEIPYYIAGPIKH